MADAVPPSPGRPDEPRGPAAQMRAADPSSRRPPQAGDAEAIAPSDRAVQQQGGMFTDWASI